MSQLHCLQRFVPLFILLLIRSQETSRSLAAAASWCHRGVFHPHVRTVSTCICRSSGLHPNLMLLINPSEREKHAYVQESFFIWIAPNLQYANPLFNINWLIKSLPAGWQRCEINKLHVCDVDKSSQLQWSGSVVVARGRERDENAGNKKQSFSECSSWINPRCEHWSCEVREILLFSSNESLVCVKKSQSTDTSVCKEARLAAVLC